MKISLRYKTTLGVALTQVVLLGILLGSNLFQTRANLEQELHVHASVTAELLAVSATEAVLALDIAKLKNLVQSVVDKHRVKYVAILDHRGQVLAQAGNKTDLEPRLPLDHPIKVADSLFGTVQVEISRAPTQAALARNTQTNFLIAGLGMLVVAVVSLSLGWFLTRKLNLLAQGVRALGQGDYNARVVVNSHDEVGLLAARFNAMAEQLDRKVQELAQSQKRFRDMAEDTSDWLWETDVDGRYTYCSKRVESLLGFASEEIVGRHAFDLMATNDAARMGDLFEHLKHEQQPFYDFEYHAEHKDGRAVVLEASGHPIVNDTGALTGYRGVTRDVTRRKDDESRLIYLAEHDSLTGLNSRQKFLDQLQDAVAVANANQTSVMLLLIDLDDFKMLNDAHGHLAGDSLLRVIAETLSTRVTSPHALARLGSDEFGVILKGLRPEEGTQMAKRLLAAIESAPLAVGEAAVRISACVGIAAAPEAGRDSATLLAHADIALQRAKGLGHNRYHAFSPADKDLDVMREAVNWHTLIQDALEQGRLFLEYQPIANVSNRSPLLHFEALVRLKTKSGTVYSAGQFMGTAEVTGQVADIDKWVLDQVLKLLADPNFTTASISMNLSGRSLGTPGFDTYFEDKLAHSQVHPQRLIFEITETSAIAEMARAKSFLSTMKRLGFRFSLDDFGVGFSSFSYLKHLPVDQIKIDGSFIRHLDTNREDQIFVRAIIQVARELGLQTVAEFVETQAALDLLTQFGIDYVQGYYVGKPQPILSKPTVDIKLSLVPNPRHRNKA
jgi:diguanylate cyclase (GGDEF)-like protein/PAS domain S-box-containing protein